MREYNSVEDDIQENTLKSFLIEAGGYVLTAICGSGFAVFVVLTLVLQNPIIVGGLTILFIIYMVILSRWMWI